MPVFDAAPAMVCSPGAMVAPASAPASAVAARPAGDLVVGRDEIGVGLAAAALPTRVVPVTTPGGKPVG